MDRSSFEQSFMKIISTFGNKNYSAERIALIYNEVRSYSASDFNQLVSHMVGNYRNAPLVIDFKKAIFDLNLRPERKEVIETTATPVQPENLLYHLDGNAWADNTHIYLRGNTSRDCGFIVKADYPHHPLVNLDNEVRAKRISEIKDHLKNKSYQKFDEAKSAEMKRINYASYFSSEGA